MSVTWNNLYTDGYGMTYVHKTPQEADHYASSWEGPEPFTKYEPEFVRVEQRWNGHWLRPCVGMRSDEASHVVGSKDFEGRDWYLVPRQDACIHVWSISVNGKPDECLFCQRLRK